MSPRLVACTITSLAFLTPSVARPQAGQDISAAAEMARKLQDPLANISALMSDNDILFKTGEDGEEETSYSFSIQPVQAFPFTDKGFNFIARAVIPIQGLAPEAQRPPIGEPLPPGDSHTWGLGDIQTQFFFSPTSDSKWKWGLGPVFSWKSHSTEKLKGPGWGAGPVGVLVGGFGNNISTSFIVSHMWGFKGDFSTSMLHPMVFYNLADAWTLMYNIPISFNWKADSDDVVTLPVGLGVGKTIDIGGGMGLDLSGGPYWNVVRPDGAATWQLKYGITLLLP